jgi:hypothetical protein
MNQPPRVTDGHSPLKAQVNTLVDPRIHRFARRRIAGVKPGDDNGEIELNGKTLHGQRHDSRARADARMAIAASAA